MAVIDRCQVLASTACAVLLEGTARAVGRTISGALLGSPSGARRRRRRAPGPWQFFTHDEAVVVEAIA
jgi:gluconate 2-dehydrogenase gamma chain